VGKDVLRLLLIVLLFSSCATVATQSEDGKTLKIRGTGSAKFENGAEIEGKTWIPDLPKVEWETNG